jgi:hypothetical protein
MMDFSCYDDMTLEELRDEREELRKAIDNEHIWAKGSHSVEDLNMHAQNITDMRIRINYITDLIEEREMA